MQRSKQLVVIDVNVFLSALLTPNGKAAQLWEAIVEGWFISVTSEEILEELQEVLVRPKFQLPQQLQKDFFQQGDFGIIEDVLFQCLHPFLFCRLS